MPIDVITSEQPHDRGKDLLHLDDKQVNLLRPAFRVYRERTGRRIDEYGITAFPQGTLSPLINVLRESLVQANTPAEGRAVRELLTVLASADSVGQGLILDGS
jgi:hypothetical protein